MRATARPAHALTRASAQTFPAAKRSCAPTTGTDAEQRSAGGLAACAQKPFVADGRAVGHDFPATTRRTCVDLQPADIAPTSGTTVPLTEWVPSTCLLAPIPFPRAVAITDHSSSSRHSRAELRPCVTRPLSFAELRTAVGPRVRRCSKLVAEPSCAVLPTEDCETVRGDSTHLKACDPLPERRVFANVHTVGKHLGRAPRGPA